MKRLFAAILAALLLFGTAYAYDDTNLEGHLVTVTARLLNGRMTPNKGAMKTAFFDKGDIVELTGRWSDDHDWVEVIAGEAGTCWVARQYVTENEEPFIVYNRDYNKVKIRKKPYEKSKIPYHGGGAGDIFYEYFPIKFPYNPPARRYKIVTREYLTDRKNGDFDTKMYVGIITPDGETISVNRYFGETDAGWEELNLSEFIDRIDAHYRRIEAERKDKNQNGSI